MRNYIICLCYTLCVFGCNSGNKAKEMYFTDNIEVLDSSTILHEKIEGKPLKCVGIKGVSGIVITNEHICISTQMDNPSLYVYNLFGGLMCSFDRNDCGLMDFGYIHLTGQWGIEDGQVYIWANDVNVSELKRINISKSIKQNTCVIDKRVATQPYSMNAFALSDSSSLSETLIEDNYVINHEYTSGKTSLDEKLYAIDIPQPFSYYKSEMCINEDENTICFAMRSINQVNFYNYLNKHKKSISIGNVKHKKDIVSNTETGLENWVYYTRIYSTAKFVYCLYLNQSYEDAFSKPKKTEIHIFNYEGEYVRSLLFDRYIYIFGVTNDDTTLYGLYSSELFEYDIK